MVENQPTMAQPGTCARLLFVVLLLSMSVGSSTMELARKTLDAHQSIHPIGYSPVTAAGLLIESSKTNPGASESATPHQPASPSPAARNDGGREISNQPADLRRNADQRRSQYCLALNVYWEARNQAMAGQLAVAQVTMNRVRDPRYPNDICEVVFDRSQFSWYWDGLSDRPKEIRAWENALRVASAAIAGSGHADLDRVTHYHAVYIQPYWKDSMILVATIGDHLFYSEQSPLPPFEP